MESELNTRASQLQFLQLLKKNEKNYILQNKRKKNDKYFKKNDKFTHPQPRPMVTPPLANYACVLLMQKLKDGLTDTLKFVITFYQTKYFSNVWYALE